MNFADSGNTNTDMFHNAPMVIIVLVDNSIPTSAYDGSYVLNNLLDASYAYCLAGCKFGFDKNEFESEEGKQFLNELKVPDNYRVFGCCGVGYAETKSSDSSIIEKQVYWAE